VSAKRRASATITPNNSLQDRAPVIQIPGVETRIDGDVVRIELPGNRMFEHGGARMLPEAAPLLDQVAAEVMRAYPDQIIGVEGHTDSDPVAVGSKWQSNHQLSIGRAMAVYDYLAGRARIPPSHLFVVGHGANHPVVSNGTLEGKQRNRRVELVVYPDRVGGR
jgi:chemotaxis protein MotB